VRNSDSREYLIPIEGIRNSCHATLPKVEAPPSPRVRRCRGYGGAMRRTVGIGVAALALSIGLVGCGGTTSSPPLQAPTRGDPVAADPSLKSTQLAAVVTASMQKNQIPGAAVSVLSPGGRWVYTPGYADIATKAAVGANDKFAIRSITKSMTVTVVLQMVGEGRLSLMDAINKFVVGVPNGSKITIADLAGMHSGLQDYSKNPAFIKKFAADFDQPWTTDQLLNYAYSLPSLFAPGTKYDYSNTNCLLLGRVIEKLTGQSWDTQVQTRILGPLGMSATSYPGDNPMPTPASLGYAASNGKPSPLTVNFTALQAAGGDVGTLDDLQTWGIALAGGSLLKPEIQQRRLAAAGPATNGPTYDSYGLGIGSVQGWWGHSGSGLGYQAMVMTDPVSRATVTILLNAANNSDAQEQLFVAMLAVLKG
jgi:D-alanyl-D-alanine carboxypeptidase